jgi:hypothetical protein
MPSNLALETERDERVTRALQAVSRSIAAYRSGVVTSLERVRAMLATGGASRSRRELGAFAAGRIDADRFAEVAHGAALDTPARARIARCAEVLLELSGLPDDAFVVDVPSGRRPIDIVNAALAKFGRAFHAATTADLVRGGTYDPMQGDGLKDDWGFERWSKAERRIAPPIVVTVDGSDLHVAAFAELLDGTERIVLVVRGTAAPAPLARLITPNTFVLQTTDATGLEAFSAYDGPAIAAFMPENTATFVHNPERGSAPWQRLEIWRRPAAEPRRTIGGLSPRQQREELLHLEALAAQPTLPTGTVDALVPHGSGNATERLADWLLAQSGLTESK